jgi:predicted NBD/HSP70 family sugar kinase
MKEAPSRQARNSNGGMRRVDLKDIQLGSNDVGRMINRDIVLQLIRTSESVSRAELARLSGLQRSTVSEIADQLLREGWICEGATRRTARGRHPTMLRLNDALATLAVDIHPGQAVVAMVDLNGWILASSNLPIGKDPAIAIKSIVTSLKRLRDSFPNKSLEGIGVSVPGRVSTRTQRLVFAPNLGWHDFDLKHAIEKEMGMTAEIENAANSSLISELWFGRMDGVRNAAMVTVSEGIGAGILANGVLVRGHDGTAGEFGHIPFACSDLLCGCGQVGCWETVASNSAAVRYYAELAPASNAVSFEELLNLSVEGDPNATKALEKQAAFLGKGSRMLAYAFSPEVVMVSGALVSIWERIAPIMEKELTNPPLPGITPRLQPTYEGGFARLRGAAATLLQRHSGMHAVRHISVSQTSGA